MSELILEANTENLDKVLDFVNPELENAGCNIIAIPQITAQ